MAADTFELNLFDQPSGSASPGSTGALRAGVEGLVRDLLRRPDQPTASELIDRVEEALGWAARWEIWSVIRQLREDRSIESYQRNYLNTVLTDEEIRSALAASVDLKKVHKSTLDELFRNSARYRNSDAFRAMIEFTAKFREYAP